MSELRHAERPSRPRVKRGRQLALATLVAASLTGGLASTAGATLARGMVHASNKCQTLSLYLYNPAYSGTANNPRETLTYGQTMAWQTLSPVVNGWANVQSFQHPEWGWRSARVECLSVY